MHDFYRAYIDIIKSICSITYRWAGLCSAGKARNAGGLETVGSLIHSRWPKVLQRPDPSALALIFLRMASSFQHLSMIITDKSVSLWPSLVIWAATGDSSYTTVGDVETVAC